MKKYVKIFAVVLCLLLFAAIAMGSGSTESSTKDIVAADSTSAAASGTTDTTEAADTAADAAAAPADAAADTEAAPEAAEEAPAEAAGVTIQEQVLVDQDGIKITATEYVTDDIWGDGIKLLIENSTDRDYTISCDALIINDYMVSDLFVSEVAAGKSANETVDLLSSELEAAGIDTVGKVEIYFHAYDSDYNYLFENVYAEIQTSEYANMDTTPNDAGMELYNANGIRIVGKTVDEDSFWGSAILLYVENTSGQNVSISVDDMSINGFMMDPLFSTTVYDGKKAIDDITIFSSDLEENGITSIDNVELKFHIYNSETYETIADSDAITFSAQ